MTLSAQRNANKEIKAKWDVLQAAEPKVLSAFNIMLCLHILVKMFFVLFLLCCRPGWEEPSADHKCLAAAGRSPLPSTSHVIHFQVIVPLCIFRKSVCCLWPVGPVITDWRAHSEPSARMFNFWIKRVCLNKKTFEWLSGASCDTVKYKAEEKIAFFLKWSL